MMKHLCTYFATLSLALTGALCSSALLASRGCAVARAQQSVGLHADDATVTACVKARLAADDTVSAPAIGVETFKGVVHLSGFARSGRERARAEALARGADGVVGVNDAIVVNA